ncbi:hypothetical protein WJX72_008838 [[Myrmecia] bisecta]|uniref:MYND-type domain-containing protein n=1 Tax=[Myrmecia] bisecta TaxID=41462 RepID=A0AAW1R806_9CHLO
MFRLAQAYLISVVGILAQPGNTVLWRMPNQFYTSGFRHILALDKIATSHPGIKRLCAQQGFADLTQEPGLPLPQLARLHAHMTALVWFTAMICALLSSEVDSRDGDVAALPWSRKHICNRLACPISQACLTEQLERRPEACLAFEAFEGRKLRKCSACNQAFYCSPECQKVMWKQHKDFCKPCESTGLSAEESGPIYMAGTLAGTDALGALGATKEGIKQAIYDAMAKAAGRE